MLLAVLYVWEREEQGMNGDRGLRLPERCRVRSHPEGLLFHI